MCIMYLLSSMPLEFKDLVLEELFQKAIENTSISSRLIIPSIFHNCKHESKLIFDWPHYVVQ